MAAVADAVAWSAIVTAIRSMVVDVLGLPGGSVRWSDQDHPESPRPFVTLRILSGPGGMTTRPEIRSGGQKRRLTVQVATVAVQTYTITIAGVAFPFVAGGADTATTIRDGLIAAVNGGSLMNATPVAGSADILQLEDLVAGRFQTVSVSPTPDLVLVETRREVLQQAVAPEELAVSIQASAKLDDAAPSATQHARALCAKVRSALWLPARLAALRAAGCPPLRTEEIQDLTLLLDAQHETRAVLDVTFSVQTLTTEDVESIQTVDPPTGTVTPA